MVKKHAFFHALKVLGSKYGLDIAQNMVYLVPKDVIASKVHIPNRWTWFNRLREKIQKSCVFNWKSASQGAL